MLTLGEIKSLQLDHILLSTVYLYFLLRSGLIFFVLIVLRGRRMTYILPQAHYTKDFALSEQERKPKEFTSNLLRSSAVAGTA